MQWQVHNKQIQSHNVSNEKYIKYKYIKSSPGVLVLKLWFSNSGEPPVDGSVIAGGWAAVNTVSSYIQAVAPSQKRHQGG